MKKLLLLFCISPLFLFAQKNIEMESSHELIVKGMENHDKKEYYDAIKKYKKVSVNDTNYFDAQYEMALSYIELEEFAFAQKILKNLIKSEVPFESMAQVYRMLAQTYEGQKNLEEAIKTYDEGIKLFPMNHSLYFSKGITYETFEKHQEAIDCYKQALKVNLNHPGSHLRLGNIAAREGQFAQSYMSFMAFLLLEPLTDRSVGVVQLLEKIGNGTFTPEPKGVKINAEGDDFENINLFFQNQIALQDKYKVKLSYTTAYAKQFHLIITSAPYSKEDKGYWTQTYLPFFKKILEENQYDNFILYTLQPIDNAQIQKKVNKKRAQINLFRTFAGKAWFDHNKFQQMEENGKWVDRYVIYQDDGLIVGNVDEKEEAQGEWKMYFPQGNLNLVAQYKDGKKNGVWVWRNYYTQKISEESTYKDDKFDGLSKLYYPSGELKEKSTYVNGIVQDTVFLYFKNGSLKEKISVKDGKRHGVNIGYYENGTVKFKMEYKQNVADGPYKSYHPNGKLELEFTLVNDKISGNRKEYFATGQLYSDYTYTLDGLNGEYSEYHANGALAEKGTMKDGKIVGSVEEFYSNGKPSTKASYDESGKENGVVEFFDLKGNKVQEFHYSKGDLTQIKNYNEKGEVIKTIEKKGKTIAYEKLHEGSKTLRSEGKISDNKRIGKWRFYDIYGNQTAVENYNDKGEVDDSVIYYFPNGKVKSISLFENGVQQGLYLEFNKYGELLTEGLYADNERANDWYEYYPDGSLKEEYSFKDGKMHGYQKTYAVGGKLYQYDVYDEGQVIVSVYLDTAGNEIQRFGELNGTVKIKDPMNSYDRFVADYKNGDVDGPIKWLEFNKVELQGQCTNGYREGVWNWYHRNGKLSKTVTYVAGKYEGKVVDYHENGQIYYEGTYVNNLLEGEMKYYHENGKVDFQATYLNDERDGKVMSFSPTGELQQIRYYDQGVLLSFSYLDKAGKEVEPIKISKGSSTFTTYYQSGAKAITQTRLNGDLDGKYTKYYPNGKVFEEEEYVADDRHGMSVYYYESGTKKMESPFKWDEKHGTETAYYANGKVQYTQEYVFGKKHGVRKEYSSDGKLVKTIYYYNDEAISQLN